MSELQELVRLSRRYGADPEYVLAGGGNTSLKRNGVLFVKASGQTLASIGEDGFVRMDQEQLQKIWSRRYPADTDAREEAVLSDMMAARMPGETARPSVEALLHSLLPQKYIVHLHPALVNGLTCAADGEAAMKRLFGSRALWVPLVNPGYILAKTVRDRLHVYRENGVGEPEAIFLQNHGVFAGTDTPEALEELYSRIMEVIEGAVDRRPDLRPVAVDPSRRDLVSRGLRAAAGSDKGGGTENVTVYSFSNRELQLRLRDEAHAGPISSAFTPDHIVYSGFKPVWIPESVFGDISGGDASESDVSDEETAAAVASHARAFLRKNGMLPKTAVVQNTGVFTFSETALALFLDTVKVAAYSESFGGPQFMTDEQIAFIRTWEVEKYRAQVAGEG